jgi:multiple sugar transport system permease protein
VATGTETPVSLHRDPPGRQGRRLKRRIDRAGILFVAPAVLLLLTCFLYPTLRTFQYSTIDGSVVGAQRPVGLDNYQRLLTDSAFYESLWITLVYVLASGTVTIVLAFILADLLRRAGPLRAVLQGIYFYPVVLSTVIAAVVFVSVFNPFSGVMRILPLPSNLDEVNWLQSTALVVPALVLFTTWKGIGFYILMFTGSLANLPTDVLEAARVDGAKGWQINWHVVLPLLRPVLIFAWVVNIVYGFQNFALVFSLTRGGPNNASRTLPIMIYEEAFEFFNHGYASAVAVVMFFIMASLSMFVFRVLRSR